MHGVLTAVHSPAERISRDRSGNGKAIIDAGFNFGPLFIVVPRDKLERLQLLTGVVKTVHVGKRLEPCLPALLSHDAV